MREIGFILCTLGCENMIVREASLDDTQDIVAIYLTDPDKPFDRPVEAMNIAERYGCGGPWMSPESCAIHLNNLLAWGHAPLVVEEEGRAIAEAEFYIGRDIPPLDTTLDISVIYVHSGSQRRGAGTMLMEEMISRGRSSGCHYVTVSGGLGAPGFYARFGFEHLLDLATIDCDVRQGTAPCSCDPYTPEDFEMPPKSPLWVGRYQNPCQKWIEIVDKMKKRDAVLRERAMWPHTIGRYSTKHEFIGFLAPEWRHATHVDIYCWAETLTTEAILELLTHAHLAGYKRASLLCHPDVTQLVGKACGCPPAGSWSIWGKKL